MAVLVTMMSDEFGALSLRWDMQLISYTLLVQESSSGSIAGGERRSRDRAGREGGDGSREETRRQAGGGEGSPPKVTMKS